MAPKSPYLVIIRHGQSYYNAKKIFTGWIDTPLTSLGKKEAREAGILLKKNNFSFDYLFTSILRRAWQTNKEILKQMKINPKIVRDWRLNERFYGALQGRKKWKVVEEYGEEQVFQWRRGFRARPPPISPKSPMYPGNQKKYLRIKKTGWPLTESLADTYARAIPFFKKEIFPKLKKGNNVLISAHGNSLRSIMKYLEKISDKDISHVNIPTAVPRVYEFKNNFSLKKVYYLGNQAKIKKMIEAVKNEAKK